MANLPRECSAKVDTHNQAIINRWLFSHGLSNRTIYCFCRARWCIACKIIATGLIPLADVWPQRQREVDIAAAGVVARLHVGDATGVLQWVI